MTSWSGHDDGPDTALARILHDQGRLPLQTLKDALVAAREARRGHPAANLVTLLVGQGLLSPDAIRQALHPRGEPPPRFGPYQVVRELARGGMGVVYEAVHEQTGARCAVKAILGSLGEVEPEELERFRREAELQARLEHPHVGRIHSAELAGNGVYLVQELLPGGSLQDRLKLGPLPAEEAVEAVVKLCGAVEYAHGQGILHRDIKPQNVLIDEQGEPRLVDFGLARTVGSKTQRLTQTGQLLGTPGYMAPEQVRGEREDDERSDVYGLAAMLYALLTAQPPFYEGPLLVILQAVINDPPRDPRDLRPDVPRAVAEVCLRGLAKKPDDRYPSAALFAAALQASLRGERPPRRWAVPAAILLGVLLGVGGVVAAAARFGQAPGSAKSTPAVTKKTLPAKSEPTPTPTPTPAVSLGEVLDKTLSLALAGKYRRAHGELEKLPAKDRPHVARHRLGRKLVREASQGGTRLAGRFKRDDLQFARQDWETWLDCLRLLKLALDGPIPSSSIREIRNALKRKTDMDVFVALADLIPQHQHTQEDLIFLVKVQRSETARKYLAAARRALERVPLEERTHVEATFCEILNRAGGHDPELTRRIARLLPRDDVNRGARCDLLRYRSQVHERRGDFAAALRDCLAARTLRDDAALYGHEAHYLYRLGRTQGAVEAAARYLARRPTPNWELDASLAIFWDHGRTQDPERMRRAIRWWLTQPNRGQRPAFFGWWVRLAQLRLAKGNRDGCRRALLSAVPLTKKIDPSTGDLRQTVRKRAMQVLPQLIEALSSGGDIAAALDGLIRELDKARRGGDIRHIHFP